MKTVAGLDVHKDSVYLCILRENGEKIERVYGVLTPQLDSMRDSFHCKAIMFLVVRLRFLKLAKALDTCGCSRIALS